MSQATPVSRPTAPSRGELTATLERIADQALEGGWVASISIATLRAHDTILVTRGLADVEAGTKATPSTVYYMASITKEYTAAAIMRLVEQKKIGLDDPISRYVGGLPATWSPVTIRMLLSHTSGIPDYVQPGPIPEGIDWRHPKPRELVTMVEARPMYFEPGQGWRYSNTNFALLGLTIERLTGEPWATHIRRVILEPMGLRDTWFCDDVPAGRRAKGYARKNGALKDVGPIGTESPWAAGALCATPLDVARWQELLASGRLLSRDTWTLMSTAPVLPGDHRPDYGLGFVLGDLEGRRTVGHAGGIPGFLSDAIRLPEETLTVVVMVNSEGAQMREISKNVARAALGLPLAAMLSAPRDLPIPASERSRFVGRYEAPKMGDEPPPFFTVREQDGALMVQMGDGPSSRMMWEGGNEFRLEEDIVVVVTFEGADIHFRRGEERMDGTRVAIAPTGGAPSR